MAFKRISINLVRTNYDSDDEILQRSSQLAASDKTVRQKFIRDDARGVDGRISAVIEIQRVFRGHLVRLQLCSSEKKSSHSGLQFGRELAKWRTLYQRYKMAMIKSGQHTEIISFEKFCKEHNNNQWSSGQKNFKATNLSESEATIMIQRWWRRLLDMNVYRYYRDLINFRHKGDPALMLRCINPAESKLIDAASGIHVKFRLAGIQFPPHIYYKVFTHRPVQDIGAYAPRDYTEADFKRRTAHDVNNKRKRWNNKTGTAGWYKRIENNGWRIISDELIKHLTKTDPITQESGTKKIEFHHSKIQRKADMEKRRKQRKIEWMQKMYKEGMQQVKSEQPRMSHGVDVDATFLTTTADGWSDDAVDDSEVDDLLNWSTGLNFDDYWMDWQQIATSNLSEAPVYERLRLQSSKFDPYGVTLSRPAAVDVSGSASAAALRPVPNSGPSDHRRDGREPRQRPQ